MGGGEAGNSYHYVSGNLLQARDPLGLADGDDGKVQQPLLPDGTTAPCSGSGCASYAAQKWFDAGAAHELGEQGTAILEMPAQQLKELQRKVGTLRKQIASGDLVNAYKTAQSLTPQGMGAESAMRLVSGLAQEAEQMYKLAKQAGDSNLYVSSFAQGRLFGKAMLALMAVAVGAALKAPGGGRALAKTDAGLPAQCPCFAGPTLVATISGLKPIANVRVGDFVLSRSESGEQEFKRVLHVFVTPDKELLDLRFDSLDGEQSIEATAGHPFWTRERGWVNAIDLTLGDEVLTSSGAWIRVKGGTWVTRKQVVYNLEVEGFHTYFVGDVGAWVHNSCKCPTGGGASEALLPDLSSAEVDAAFETRTLGPMVEAPAAGVAGSGPHLGSTGIWFHDNLRVSGVQGAPGGRPVNIRVHSENPAHPAGYTMQINTHITNAATQGATRYMTPAGTWHMLDPTNEALMEQLHIPAGN